MDINWIEDFLALCKYGNFRISAEHRFVSQPAFSRRIKSLEAWMGASLIDRSSQPVKLTEAGVLLKPIAQEIVRLAYLSRSDIKAQITEEGMKIRFSTLSTLAQFFIPGWLKGLQSYIEPKLFNVRTDFNSLGAYLHALENGEIDYFICYEYPTEILSNNLQKFESLQLGVETLIPAVSPDRNGKPRWWLPSNPQGAIPYLRTQYTPSLRPVQDHLDKRYGHLKFQPVYESTIASSLGAMAREGYGVAWVPRSFVLSDLESGRLVRAGDENDDIELVIKIYRNANIISPQAETFWQVLLRIESAQGDQS